MTRTIYAHLHLWDPVGQMKIEPGLRYGGQTMLFVMAADDLAEGLLQLIKAVQNKGLGVIRLLYAGFTEAFEPDHFPFEADLAPLIHDAVELGKICALGPFTYAPNQLSAPEDVMVGAVDVAAPDGGALRLAAVAGSVAAGLPRLLGAVREEGATLLSLEDIKDATEHSEVYPFDTSVEDLVKRAKVVDVPVFSDPVTYKAGADA